jgi:cytochrome c oxidase subunit II
MDPWPVVAAVLAAAGAFAGTLALTAGDDRPQRAPAATARANGGLQVFARMGCGGCHTLSAASAHGQIGPDLDAALPAHDRASLRAKITDPYPGRRADLMPMMPEDFEDRMTAQELDALVSFLLDARGS